MSTSSYGSGHAQGRRQPGMAPQQQQQSQQQQQQLAQETRESSAGPSSAGYGSGGDPPSDSKSPLQLGLGFLRGIGDKRNKDGQPQKRRGPKPDSKPAQTRRQELNRQAQRTHRERKEVYIKSLEHEVMQLKEVYSGTIQEKNAVVDENRKLREMLRLNGIPFDGSDLQSQAQPPTYGSQTASAGTGGSSSAYGYQTSSTVSPPTQYQSSETSPSMFSSDFVDPQFQARSRQQSGPQQGRLDYDQLGVDFVLALEAACSDHLQYMCVRSNQDPEQPPNGHALMMSCPPQSHVENQPDVPYPHQMPDVPNQDLMRLLNLSKDLPLDGEITPVIALNMIRSHPRFYEMTLADFEALKNELASKTRCYGFGAVMEEFELRDALSGVFAIKPESYGPF